jgi:hypothetical protein
MVREPERARTRESKDSEDEKYLSVRGHMF